MIIEIPVFQFLIEILLIQIIRMFLVLQNMTEVFLDKILTHMPIGVIILLNHTMARNITLTTEGLP